MSLPLVLNDSVYIRYVANYGVRATWVKKIGTPCPVCASGRGDGIVQYSRQAHRDAGVPDCGGTCLVDIVETEIDILTQFTTDADTIAGYVSDEKMVEIGLAKSRFIIMFKAIKVSDYSLIDMDDFNEKTDKIEYDSRQFRIYQITELVLVLIEETVS